MITSKKPRDLGEICAEIRLYKVAADVAYHLHHKSDAVDNLFKIIVACRRGVNLASDEYRAKLYRECGDAYLRLADLATEPYLKADLCKYAVEQYNAALSSTPDWRTKKGILTNKQLANKVLQYAKRQLRRTVRRPA